MRSSCLPWAIASVILVLLFLLGAVVPFVASQLQRLLP